MSLTWIQWILVGGAALAAGAVNALAGGGTLITFPVLTALGIPPVMANVTNTVALLPGYLGGTFAQWEDIRRQSGRLALYLPAGLVGGLLGGYLLLNTGEKLFTQLIPVLILLASLLLAFNDPLRRLLQRRAAQTGRNLSPAWAVLPVALAAVYGGYFGAGLSVIVLASLGLAINESLTRLNALKQIISFTVNLAAAVYFIFSGNVIWPVAVVMAVCALIGGNLGGRLAGRISPSALRWTVVAIGLVVAFIYFIK